MSDAWALVALGLVPGCALVWVIANVSGWLLSRPGPWSWRVLGGADVYHRWLDRGNRRTRAGGKG